MSKAIELFAENVMEDMLANLKKPKDDKFGFIDPITILMIISITVSVIRVIQECRKNKLRGYSSEESSEYITTDVKFRALNHGFLTRLRLKRAIKKHLTSDQYTYYGDALMRSILDNGGSISQEAVCEAMEMGGE